MKKTLFLLLAASVLFSLSACRKAYNCACLHTDIIKDSLIQITHSTITAKNATEAASLCDFNSQNSFFYVYADTIYRYRYDTAYWGTDSMRIDSSIIGRRPYYINDTVEINCSLK